MADPDEDNEASESEKEKAEKRDDNQSDSSDRSEQNPTTRDHKNVTKVQFAQNQVHDDEFNHETNQLHNNKNTKKQDSNNPTSNQNSKRHRTVSESSYFSGAEASSIMSGSSSLSSMSTPANTVVETYHAPDGGYGWVVVAASFLVNMIADGVTFSFGVLFDKLEEEFGESKAVTAGVVSLFHAVPLLSGPVASALTDRYGCRKVTIVGAILASVGFLLSAFTHHIALLYITFGLISGFGLSLCYVAAVVIVAYYFDARRSFATGISVCGSGVGTFVFAEFTQFLVEKCNGWRGACIVLAGVFLNMIICGLLFRDLEWTKTLRVNKKIDRRKSKSSEQLKTGSSSSVSSPSRSSMPEVDELRTILESGDITGLFSSDELSECPRLSSSLVNIPTYLRCDEPLPDEVINALTNNKAAHKLILEHFPNSLLAKTISLEDNLVKQNLTPTTNSPNSTKNVIKLKRKVSSLFKNSHKPLRPILKKPKTSHEDEVRISVDDNDDDEIQQPLSSSGNNNSKQPQFLSAQVPSNPPSSYYLNHLRVRKQSLTYRGAMLSIPRYRLRASSCPDIYRNSMTTIAATEVESDTFYQSKEFLSGLCDCFKVWKKFMDWPYLIFALSNFILYAWYDVMYVYLYNYAETDLKINPRDATKFLSVIGIFNTLGELIIGWLGDRPNVNLNLLYSVCMIVCGGATAMVPFLSNYYALCVMAGLYGLCISANYALTSPILINLVSLEQFSNAYGFLLLVQGVSNLLGPPFAGFLYDVYKIWHYTFGLGGLFIVLSGLLLLILPCSRQVKLLRNQRLSQNKGQIKAKQDSKINSNGKPPAYV